MAHLGEGFRPGLPGGALGDDEHANGLDGAVHRFGLARPPRQGGPGRLHGVDGVGPAVSDARLAALAVDLDDLYALVSQVPGQASPVGACPLHPNLCHLAETLQPRKHCLVAGGVRCESLCSEQAPNRIERSGDVHIKVSVHAAGDGACSFYDGHGHPFLPMWSRGGTAVPDRSDGRLSLLEQAGPITLPLGRDVPLSMGRRETSADGV